MFKTLELPGALPPWPPFQGFALDPLGALSGPQTPRPIICKSLGGGGGGGKWQVDKMTYFKYTVLYFKRKLARLLTSQ